jgi:hypothetical protein
MTAYVVLIKSAKKCRIFITDYPFRGDKKSKPIPNF